MSSAPREGSAGGSWTPADSIAELGAFGLPMARGGARGWALAAVVEGFGAVVWSGWAQVGADPRLSTVLTLGALAGFALAVTGFVLAVRSAPSADVSGSVRARYLLVLVAEAVALLVGVLVLAVVGLLRWAPVWVLVVFAAHVPAVARVIGNRLLSLLGPVLLAVAVLAVVASEIGLTGPSTVTGTLAAVCLFAAGVVSLLRLRRRPATGGTVTGAGGP